MSRLAGKPVRLQFMRWDEHGWVYYGPAQLLDLRAGVDANGNIIAYDFTTSRSNSPTDARRSRPRTRAGATRVQLHRRDEHGRAVQIPNLRVTLKVLPLLDQYFKTSFMRAPFAPRRSSPTSS